MKGKLNKFFGVLIFALLLTACNSPSTDESLSSDSVSENSETISSESSSEEVHVTGVSLSSNNLSLFVGQTYKLEATVSPADAANKEVTYSSNNTAVIEVDTTGLLTAKASGDAIITVTTVDGLKTDTCNVLVNENVYEFYIASKSGYVNSDEVKINLDETKKSQTQLYVAKNGEELFEEKINHTITGDSGVISSIVESPTVDHLMEVTFANTGNARVTYSWPDHEDLGVLVVDYIVTENFLNQEIYRGNNTEDNGRISFSGQDQHTALVKKADTNYVLEATFHIYAYQGYESVGVGGFKDNGDHSLWFAFRNSDNVADGVGSVYLLDFLNGWDSRSEPTVTSLYSGVKFDFSDEMITIPFKLVRNQQNYYFSIGGYHDKYVSTTNDPNYPGFFSQQKACYITDYSVSYDTELINEMILTEWGTEATIDAGRFTNPNQEEIVYTESRSFTYQTAPSYATGSVHIEVDESYKDYVSISNETITILTNAPVGTMYVYLKNETGKTLDSFTLDVVSESSSKENELVNCKGGVILHADGSFTFPVSKMSVNGVGNEEAYDSTKAYGVDLKQTVLAGSFVMEFDVSNYTMNVQYPKLMISLGGAHNQFYIAYNYNYGTEDRIETFTQSKESNDLNNGGTWNNSSNFTSFDDTQTHHFKLESKDGRYYWYVDNSSTPLAFFMDGVSREPIVPLKSYYSYLPVRIATNGVSATISNLTVTNGDIDDLKDIYSYNNNTVADGDTVTTTFIQEGWDVKYHLASSLFASKLFMVDTKDYTLNFTVEFSSRMYDGKLAIVIGDHAFQLCNSSGYSDKVEHNYESTWGPSITGVNFSSTNLVYEITIIATSSGSVTLKTLKSDSTMGEMTVTGIDTSFIYFYTFNENASDVGKTAVIKDVQITK
ncbi:MAG: Ig-like domain-containing protein [Bacilli bacterium]